MPSSPSALYLFFSLMICLTEIPSVKSPLAVCHMSIHYFLQDTDLLQFYSGQYNCLLFHSDIISEQLWGDIIIEEQHSVWDSLTSLQASANLTFREKAGVSMIIGIGNDLSDITRVAKVLSGSAGRRFMQRVLTEGERELAEHYSGERLHQFVAGRFAAKEAVVKAFGCGIGQVMGFADIEILRDSCGKPECGLSAAAWERLGLSSKDVRIHVTITHERQLASAFAVAERISQ